MPWKRNDVGLVINDALKKNKYMKESYYGEKRRAGARAVDLGEPKLEIKPKSHCFQRSTLVDWVGQAPLGAGPGEKLIKFENL